MGLWLTVQPSRGVAGGRRCVVTFGESRLRCGLYDITKTVLRVGPDDAVKEGDWSDRVSCWPCTRFYPSKADLLAEAMAGWTIVVTFFLLIILVW